MPIIGGRSASVRGLGFQGVGKPSAPIDVSATNVGTSRAFNNGAATVTFTAGSSNGAEITSFTVTSSPGSYTATGASSPLTVQGLQSNTAYTFTVTATNMIGTSDASSASSSITATTVPATPSAPSASSPSAGIDRVTWSAPESGGSAITGYTWASSDGKSGSTASTSVDVNQEQGTAQTYTVYATNANGNSGTSSASGSVTTTFSFAPFGFSPFGFTPAPFGFAPFGFSPAPPVFSFGGAWFGPGGGGGGYGFSAGWSNSIDVQTKIRTPNGLKPAGEIQVGDTVYSLNIPSDLDEQEWLSWSSDPDNFTANIVETTVTSVLTASGSTYVYVDGDMFTPTHYILTKKDDVIKFIKVDELDNTYQRYSYEINDFVDIEIVEDITVDQNNVSIHCEPHDNFFTEQMLVLESLPH
jgi:hypothetical protein